MSEKIGLVSQNEIKGSSQTYRVDRFDPRTFDEATRSHLLSDLTTLTALGFMRGQVEEGLKADVADHVLGGERLSVVYGEDNRPIGYLVSAVFTIDTGESVYHVEGLISHPDYMGKGVAIALALSDVRDARPDLLAFHTQFEPMRRLGLKLAYQNNADALRLNPFIGTRNAHTSLPIDIGRYGGLLYGDSDRYERYKPQGFESFDAHRGDALVCAGPIRKEVIYGGI